VNNGTDALSRVHEVKGLVDLIQHGDVVDVEDYVRGEHPAVVDPPEGDLAGLPAGPQVHGGGPHDEPLPIGGGQRVLHGQLVPRRGLQALGLAHDPALEGGGQAVKEVVLLLGPLLELLLQLL